LYFRVSKINKKKKTKEKAMKSSHYES